MTTLGPTNHLSIVSNPWEIASLVKPNRLQLIMRATSKNNTQVGQFLLTEPGLSVGRPFFMQLSGRFGIPPPNAMTRSPSLCINLSQQPIEIQVGMLGVIAAFFKNADQIIANLPIKPRTICVSPSLYTKDNDPNLQCQMYGNITTDVEGRFYNPQNPDQAHLTHFLVYNAQTGRAEYTTDENDSALSAKIEQFTNGNYLTFDGTVILRLQVFETIVSGQRHIKFHPDPAVIFVRSFIRPFLPPMENYFNDQINLLVDPTKKENEETECIES